MVLELQPTMFYYSKTCELWDVGSVFMRNINFVTISGVTEGEATKTPSIHSFLVSKILCVGVRAAQFLFVNTGMSLDCLVFCQIMKR